MEIATVVDFRVWILIPLLIFINLILEDFNRIETNGSIKSCTYNLKHVF